MIFPQNTLEELYDQALQDTIWAVKEALETEDECRIGLAGGSTPQALYEKMAGSNLPWDKIVFIQLDERYVLSDEDESNLKMLRRSLFNQLPQQAKEVITFDTSLAYEQASKEMDRKLNAKLIERKPLFDLLILGAGADGHVASLFSSVDLTADLALNTTAKAYKTQKRLSLGMGALSQAKQALLLLVGESKLEIANSLQGHSQSTPIQVLVQKVPTKVLTCALESKHI